MTHTKFPVIEKFFECLFKPNHNLFDFKYIYASCNSNSLYFRYCNHRVMVYSYEGHFISQFESKVDQLTLNIPHSLALSRDGAELYVADRENYRIIKYNTTTGVGTVFVPPGGLDGAIYAISFSNRQGDWPLYAVNGSMADNKDCSGFTIDENGRILGKWMPGAKVWFCIVIVMD